MQMMKGFWLLYLMKGMRGVQKRCRVEVCREEKGWAGSSISNLQSRSSSVRMLMQCSKEMSHSIVLIVVGIIARCLSAIGGRAGKGRPGLRTASSERIDAISLFTEVIVAERGAPAPWSSS